MRILYQLLIVAVLMVFSTASPSAAAAADGNEKNLMVKSFVPDAEIVPGKVVPFHAEIGEFSPSEPSKSLEAAKQANVFVYFTQGDKQIKKGPLENAGSGLFKGTVSLPDDGEWQVRVIAFKSKDSAADTYGQMQTIWKAEQVKSGSSYIWLIAIAAAAVLFILWRLFSRRKKRAGQ